MNKNNNNTFYNHLIILYQVDIGLKEHSSNAQQITKDYHFLHHYSFI